MRMINKIITILIIFLLIWSFGNIINREYDKMVVQKQVESNVNMPSEKPQVIEKSMAKSDEPAYKAILEIPKLNLKRGFYDSSSNLNQVDKNITLLEPPKLNDLEENLVVIAAHSGSSRVSFFHNLGIVDINDNTYIYFAGQKYNYQVVNKYETAKDGTLEIYNNDKGYLYLTTCSETDKTKQLVLEEKLVSVEPY